MKRANNFFKPKANQTPEQKQNDALKQEDSKEWLRKEVTYVKESYFQESSNSFSNGMGK